jgi:uncharacterized protein (DUF2252 family)
VKKVKGNTRNLVRFSARLAALTACRNLKMAQSAQAYVRGNTRKFYEWLESIKVGRIPVGPAVWIGGDCHVGNLGPLADEDGNVDIQIRDLDQSVIGNPVHDLIRLGLSLATAARGSDLPGVTTAKMLGTMIDSYERAFGKASRGPESQHKKPDSIRDAMRRSTNRTWKELANDRIEDTNPTIPRGKRFWPLREDEKREIRKLFKQEDVRRLTTSLYARKDKSSIKVLDAAYWRKGCSSLGRLRYAVLLGIGKPPYRGKKLCLMDIKEAVKPAAPRYPRVHMPRDNAKRVVEGARHLAPNLGERMVAAKFFDKSVFIRELLPQDLQLEIEQLTRVEAMKAAGYLAAVLGQAHARQMDTPTKKKWQANLRRYRTKQKNAPSWLWSSVVELQVIHEAEYLEHCRKYAMNLGRS